MQRAASGGSYSLPLFLHQPNGVNEGRTHYRDVKQLEELAQHGFAIASSSHLQPGNRLAFFISLMILMSTKVSI